jgi:hypothetical protein
MTEEADGEVIQAAHVKRLRDVERASDQIQQPALSHVIVAVIVGYLAGPCTDMSSAVVEQRLDLQFNTLWTASK